MGFRFRRSISLGKRLRLNLNKRSASLSIGGPGGGFTFGRRRSAHVGLPGSGLSYSTPIFGHHVRRAKRAAQTSSGKGFLVFVAICIAFWAYHKLFG